MERKYCACCGCHKDEIYFLIVVKLVIDAVKGRKRKTKERDRRKMQRNNIKK